MMPWFTALLLLWRPVVGREVVTREPFLALKLESHMMSDSEAKQRALDLIRETYPAAYSNSTISHHFFLRLAPATLQEAVSEFVWNSETLRAIKSRFPPGTIIVPDVYHEIYLMRPEMDFVDANKAHYDGILKLPGICTLRSLTYLEGDPATFVAATSMLNYTTDQSSAILLDFNRELHYAIIANRTNTKTNSPRVIIKAAIHVFPSTTPSAVAVFHILAHRIVFFAIKSPRNAFESSESDALMTLDNLMRSLNKIHMSLPLLAISVPMAITLSAPLQFPLQMLPYLFHILLVCVWRFPPARIRQMRSLVTCIALGRAATTTEVEIVKQAPNLLLHIAWHVICRYMELNAEMARCILLAPIPAPIQL